MKKKKEGNLKEQILENIKYTNKHKKEKKEKRFRLTIERI